MKATENFVSNPDWGLELVVADLREVRRQWRESCARNHECGGREMRGVSIQDILPIKFV
jgi:hypothetical protein